jgi:membrane fusion protein
VVRLRASRQSTIGAVHVKDGQHVTSGDSLVSLQSGQTMESGAGAEAEIAAQLDSQHRDIEAQIARESDWRRNEERRLTVAYDEFDRDIGLITLTTQTLQQLTLTQRHADRIRDLAEHGTVSLDELQRRDLAVLAQRLALQNSDREIASKRAQLVAAGIAIEQLPTVANERLRGLREALANVQQKLIELEARRAVVMRAPLSGRIAAVPVFVGAAVDSGSLIAAIIPDESELRARLFVPTRAIGKVRPGQTVSIRYDAFPYQKYGTFKGQIEDVSNSVILPQELERGSPVKLTEPAYVLDVTIRRQSVTLDGERQAALRPDMLLTATIETDRRTILGWIGESVFGVAQR